MDPMDDTPEVSTELNFSATPEPVVVAPEPQVVKIHGKLDRNGVAIGTGRRKTSVARVRLKPGNGATSINGRRLEEYFNNIRDLQMIEAPLRVTEKLGQVDLWVRVNGGGTTGQTGAIVMGIARALEALNPSLHPLLSENGFLTRDSRMVERKKYGFKKARRSPQFSKR
jgi:small subunit ribosomal protein S9